MKVSGREEVMIVNTPITGKVCPDRTYDMKTECSALLIADLSKINSAKIINRFCHTGDYQSCPIYKERHEVK